MISNQLQRLQKIPGFRAFKERVLLPRNHGSWLYSGDVFDWTVDEALVRQLPTSHRLFVKFCRQQLDLWGVVVMGNFVRSSIVRFGPASPIRLSSAGRVVYLDPYDPRMLVVPNEVFGTTSVGLALETLLSPGDTFLDVGANHGSYSIIASDLVGPDGHVYAFEPQPAKAEVIRRSFSELGLGREVHQVACADYSGTVSFFIPAASSGAAGVYSRFSGREAHSEITVRAARLDALLESDDLPGNLVMKLDVEGAELVALRGATKLLVERHPTLLMEINATSMSAADVHMDSLLKELLDAGYSEFRCVSTNDKLPLTSLPPDIHQNVVIW